jgi:shikimate 5-dehydrogenase
MLDLKSPSMLFIGVTTGQSSINKVFPRWAKALGLPTNKLAGYDVAPNAPADTYRRIVSFIKENENALGALVTTHKINMIRYAHDLFDSFDAYAEKLGEVSSISKDGRKLVGCAKDPISSGRAFEAFAGTSYWNDNPKAEACILGSGGSALAFSVYLLEEAPDNRPAKIILSGHSSTRLHHLRDVLSSYNPDIPIEYVQVATEADRDDLVCHLPGRSLVANATGMGKDRPGSPITDRAAFPWEALVWEFNYRGDLEFLEQARRQEAAHNLKIEDGWTYFIFGWALVVAEVFHFELTQEKLDAMKREAEMVR